MENLFYGREISNKFDLKGSERNRLVDPSNQHGEIVLLDENLVQSEYRTNLTFCSHYQWRHILLSIPDSVLVEASVCTLPQQARAA